MADLATHPRRGLEVLTEGRLSRRAGAVHASRSEDARLAPAALGVLTHVGYILRRVTTSASLTRQHMASLGDLDFQIILGELRTRRGRPDDYLDNHERGRHLLAYFAALVEDRETRLEEAFGELHALADSVQQVVRLVASLNAFESDTQVEFLVDLGESVLEVTLPSETGSESVVVYREVEELGQVRIDRSRLLEVLVTLVRNAIQALDQHGGDGRVVVRVRPVEPSRFCMEGEDNGKGIRPEHLDRIFQLGFTTRDDGSGFGLHLAGNLVRELDGQLQVESAGPGQGATFRLVLPRRQHLEQAA